MKRNFKVLIIAAFLVTAPLLMLAQPPHPNQNLPASGSNTKVGDSPSGAPVGNGTFILMALAAAYAGRKVYVMRTAAPAEE